MDGLPSVIPQDVAFGFALLGRRGARILGSLLKLRLSLPASTLLPEFSLWLFPWDIMFKKEMLLVWREGRHEGRVAIVTFQ